MIVKGKARANGRQLAAYLLAQGDNEQKPELVEQAAYDGMDLDFALRALEAEAIGTRCRKPLYHAQIVPGPGEHLTREQFAEAVAMLEEQLGLAGQPRIVVSHIKNGTEHQHIVWGCIDRKTDTAIEYTYNWRDHEQIARKLEVQFDLRRVQGKHFDENGEPLTAEQKRARRAERVEERVTFTHAEQAQEQRGAKPKHERLAEIRAIWNSTTTGRELRDRLAQAGYTLARGDRRTFVVVDRAGEAHSLARQAGVTTKEIKARLVDINPSSIPTVQEVREAMRRTAQERAPLAEEPRAQEQGRERPSIEPQAAPARPQEPPRAEPERVASRTDADRALDDLTRQHSTFTHGDLERLARKVTETTAGAEALIAAVEEHPELVHLGFDRTGSERFTSRAMLGTELRMEAHAAELAGSRRHRVHPRIQDAVPNVGKLTPERDRAYRHMLAPDGLSIIEGYAGTGKTQLLGTARKAWVAAGYRVQGAALSGIAAEGMQQGSQIESRTLHSLIGRLETGKQTLTAKDVIVLDEAGMVGSRQMKQLLSHVTAARAKLLLVGDAEQLQAIDAGGAFRALKERHGAATLTDVRRQASQWQAAATVEFATEKTAEALNRYQRHGMTHEAGSRDQAKDAMVGNWSVARAGNPEQSHIMLAYLRADVRELNERARSAYRQEGRLGTDHVLTLTDRDGARHRTALAAGDRSVFPAERHAARCPERDARHRGRGRWQVPVRSAGRWPQARRGYQGLQPARLRLCRHGS